MKRFSNSTNQMNSPSLKAKIGKTQLQNSALKMSDRLIKLVTGALCNFPRRMIEDRTNRHGDENIFLLTEGFGFGQLGFHDKQI